MREGETRARRRQQILGHANAVGLDERLPYPEPHRLVERAGHRAADEHSVDLGSSCAMTSILPEIFAPPRIATNGRLRLGQRLPQVLQLLLHQEPRNRRAEHVRDSLGRRVGAMRGAERVIHEQVAQCRQCPRQLGVIATLRRAGSACSP